MILDQNYPNPFNPETRISFSLPEASNVELNVFNIKGQLVKTLVKGVYSEGKQNIIWDGTDNNNLKVGSGIYFYKLKTEKESISRKMLLVK
jgi:flagellar hook assembly protein FlgD